MPDIGINTIILIGLSLATGGAIPWVIRVSARLASIETTLSKTLGNGMTGDIENLFGRTRHLEINCAAHHAEASDGK